MNNRDKKVLVLGATGAMGKYLVPRLAEMGYTVDGVSWDDVKSDRPNLRYIQGNAKDWKLLDELLKNHYDGIVDFMIYPTGELFIYLPVLLANTDHYIYLSTYRVYDNKEHPIKESSPRLIDSSEDAVLRNSDDYCIFKARGENILRAGTLNNWTAIRPAITYSLMRYQLVTLEAAHTVGRAFAGKSVVLPEQAADIQATMSWGGDVAKMIAHLLFNPKAIGEIFTVSTAEHHTWREIADYYKDICNLNPVWVDKEDYLKLVTSRPHFPGNRWQLEYDRLFSRVMDNSKVLEVTGMKQPELMKLYDGLKYEISRCPKSTVFPVAVAMDEYLAARGIC